MKTCKSENQQTSTWSCCIRNFACTWVRAVSHRGSPGADASQTHAFQRSALRWTLASQWRIIIRAKHLCKLQWFLPFLSRAAKREQPCRVGDSTTIVNPNKWNSERGNVLWKCNIYSKRMRLLRKQKASVISLRDKKVALSPKNSFQILGI